MAEVLEELLERRDLRHRMSHLGQSLVDGQGAERVVSVLEKEIGLNPE